MTDENYVNEDGELISSTIADLQLALTNGGRELRALRQAYGMAQEQKAALTAALAEVRHENMALRDRLATVEVPAGSMRIVGRLVVMPGNSLAVVSEGRPVRMACASGWDFGLPTGTVVVAEAHLQPRVGWMAWQVRAAAFAEAENIPPLDAGLVDKLTTVKPQADPASKLPGIEDIDLDRDAGSDLRRHAHHVSQIALHVVLVRHRRGVDFALTDAMASALKLDVKDVVERTLGWKLLAVNTGSIDERHKHDHLHLAVSHVDATKPISHEVGRLKAITSKRMRAQFPELAALDHMWGAGMYLSAFGGPNRDAVIQYVRAQEQ